MEFDFLIARGASIGVYGRKNAVPTLTQNDLREVLNGVRARNGRDANGNQVQGVQELLLQLCEAMNLVNVDGT